MHALTTRRSWSTAIATAALLSMVCTLLVAQDAVAPAARADTSSINNNDENSVNTAYGTALKNYLDVPAGWTGSTQSCAAGSPSAATQTATLSAINFVRSLSGLDDVSLDATLSARAQQTALMMAANNTLNHTPPTSWKCYSDAGATAAGMSNLAMSWPAITGAGAISQYMADGGSNNLAAGHRRWILNPTTTTMGSGTTATTNALQVFGAQTNSAATAPQWISWPSAGYFPGDLEPAGRWSLSASSAKTTFAAASVTVRNASGTALPVTVHPTALGYGPNTLVWDVTGLTAPTSAAPATYTVTVDNITKGSGGPSSYSYQVRLFTPYPVAAAPSPPAAAPTPVAPAPAPVAAASGVSVTRLAGADRYATAVQVSARYASGVPVVYVATGSDYPDALSAAPAAAAQGGPLLLVAPNSLPAVVRAEIVRLAPRQIVVVGGTGVVSAAVYEELRRLGHPVRRDAGIDRYDTSRIVTQNAFGSSGASMAYVATGANFPDALAASAAAGALPGPVVLVNGSGTSIPTGTRTLLTNLGVSRLAIAGGTGVVSPAMESALRSVPGITNVNRLAGADRYLTSGAINRAAFTTSQTVFLAVGTGYADALAGAALAGKNNAPLYVVPGSCVPSYVLADIASLSATSVTLLGGTGVLTTGVEGLVGCR